MRKILGITMGDPAGVGPEITVKALQDPKVYESCKPLVVGDAAILERACGFVGAKCTIHPVADPSEGLYEHGIIDILDLGLLRPEDFAIGQVSAAAGDAAFRYVRKVIELAMDGKVDATVTNPLNKEAMNLAGHHFSGHTEIYAYYTGTEHYTMMLAHKDMRVVHVSTHVSLREACDRVKKDRVLEVIRIADKACRDMGIASPRIGVAGLNPHCGEGGLFGREEIDEITPAIEAARTAGINAQGPIPPDTIFSKALGGWYDIVVAMYHDQGHIPLKVVGFVYDREKQAWSAVEGVNITLGLPIIRTSVDHGTAFDQAGTGKANELSLKNAIEYGYILTNPRFNVFAGMRNSFLYTALGTLLAVACTYVTAYVLSRPRFKHRYWLMSLFIITWVFDAGIIPQYIIYNQFGFVNSPWVMIVPGAISTQFLIITKTFLEGIPNELEEAAVVDGASDIKILTRVFLPLSPTVLATTGLFYAVSIWNQYLIPQIYLKDDAIKTIQQVLKNVVITDGSSGTTFKNVVLDGVTLNQQNLKAAAIFIAMLPIICVYPFVQKYFKKGILIGSVKG